MLPVSISRPKVSHDSVCVVAETISMCLKLLTAHHPANKVTQEVRATLFGTQL